jgi:putative membrane protein
LPGAVRRCNLCLQQQGEGAMSGWAKGLVGLVAALHVVFLVLEMFFWTKPLGRKIFQLDQFGPGFPEKSKTLAANMGLYNGFLALGLFWSIWPWWLPDGAAKPVALFFLLCVLVAGIFGAVTVKKTILYFQALPAAIALALVILT